jgi:Domain of unknown function (DUF4349)
MRPYLVSTLALTAALALTACSKAEDLAAVSSNTATEAAAAADSASTTSEAGPDIGGIVAPGVAFTYDYAFTLPTKAISGVQREHAVACERLGTSRCRVTGMRYEQPGEDRVDAALDFLLAPDLAHRFASEGIAAVERAEGKLVNARVNGENVGDAIVLSQQNSAAIQAEVARIDARLKVKGLTRDERAELSRRAEDLRDQLRGQAGERRAKETALATTPVRFGYSSEGLISGSGTFGKAASASLDSMSAALAFVLLLAGVALPWIGLIALLVLGWRVLKRRTLSPQEPTPTP